jgi:hypothetical protein
VARWSRRLDPITGEGRLALVDDGRSAGQADTDFGFDHGVSVGMRIDHSEHERESSRGPHAARPRFRTAEHSARHEDEQRHGQAATSVHWPSYSRISKSALSHSGGTIWYSFRLLEHGFGRDRGLFEAGS